jgi:hypothetical protein
MALRIVVIDARHILPSTFTQRPFVGDCIKETPGVGI